MPDGIVQSMIADSVCIAGKVVVRLPTIIKHDFSCPVFFSSVHFRSLMDDFKKTDYDEQDIRNNTLRNSGSSDRY